MTGSAHGQTPPRLERRADDSPRVEPDEHGNRAERRLWQRKYGKRVTPQSALSGENKETE